jgi:hypothetical protein
MMQHCFLPLLALPLLLVADPTLPMADAPVTLTGEIVDVSCYQERGIAAGTGAAHVACAKECAKKEGHLFGILTDGDGLFRITGDYAADKYAKLIAYIGNTVQVTGTLTRGLDYTTVINVTTIKLSEAKNDNCGGQAFEDCSLQFNAH